MSDLKEIREKLNQVDEAFVNLVADRLDLIREVGKLKSTKSGNIRDVSREREVLARVEKAARKRNISVMFAKKLFREIMDYALSEETREFGGQDKHPHRKVTVAYQGIEQSYSHLTAQSYFSRKGASAQFNGYRTFKEVFTALTSGLADYAVLPIENTTAGSINQVYDLLLENDVFIIGEDTWKVKHCLIGKPGAALKDIRKIYSHPRAIEQCTDFLGGLPSKVKVESFYDTAGAVKKVAKEKSRTQAAIASAEAAEAFGLSILKRNIANQEENHTRFVVLSRTPAAYDTRISCKTSLILSARHEHGALARCLEVLSRNDLNMTKLESRPFLNRPWEYLFYLDFEGNMADPKVAVAVEELKAQTLYIKVLGSYPGKTMPIGAALTGVPREQEPQASLSPESPVEKTAPVVLIKSKNYKLVSRDHQAENTLVRVGDLLIGKQGFVVMAGPCSVESADQIDKTARWVKEQGGHLLRGGVFKPRTSPYSFQGLGWEGLDLLVEAGKRYGLPIITEVLAPEQVRGVAEKADILQIGARNMQNFPLLRDVGKVNRPVLLKRGLSSTLEELLAAAEYIVSQGNGQVMLCERGIRTFETATRNTLDLSAVPVLEERTHLPIIVDPSHGTGNRRYVLPMSLAAQAAGAHGLLIEVHPNPDKALSDGDQSITFPEFSILMQKLQKQSEKLTV